MLQIIFSVIAASGSVKTTDYNVTGLDDAFAPSKINDLPDAVRNRRKINETHSSEDGSHDEMTKMDEPMAEQPTKVPLHGIITDIEKDLVTTALLASTQLHKRQSTAELLNFNSNMENCTDTENDSIDTNENLFKDLFNFTRSERQSDGIDVKIPLNGLVSAVESTLINSAQNLRDSKQLHRTIDANDEINSNGNETHRIDRDTNDEFVHVQTLDAKKSIQNLSILSPIVFKPVHDEMEINTTTFGAADDIISTTDYPDIQNTNFTMIQASDTVRLIPDGENKVAHVQHQVISKTVFQSNLTIVPTIAPTSLVIPLSITSAESIDATNENSALSTTMQSMLNESTKNEQNAKHDELVEKTLVLKEKFAEVQAQPVILSQFP